MKDASRNGGRRAQLIGAERDRGEPGIELAPVNISTGSVIALFRKPIRVSKGEAIVRTTKLFLMAGCAVLLLSGLAAAQMRWHPGYLQALSNLREAKAELSQMTPDDRVAGDVQAGLHELDATIHEVEDAASADRVSLDQLPPPEQGANRGRLEQVAFLLDRAQDGLARRELNPFAAGEKDRAMDHLSQARNAINRALESERREHEWRREHREREHEGYDRPGY